MVYQVYLYYKNQLINQNINESIAVNLSEGHISRTTHLKKCDDDLNSSLSPHVLFLHHGMHRKQIYTNQSINQYGLINLSTCSRCQRPLPWLPECLSGKRKGSAWWWRNTLGGGLFPHEWPIRTARSGSTDPPLSSVPRSPPSRRSYRLSKRWFLSGNTCRMDDVIGLKISVIIKNTSKRLFVFAYLKIYVYRKQNFV